jgi:hypothetical protein
LSVEAAAQTKRKAAQKRGLKWMIGGSQWRHHDFRELTID